MPTRDLPPAAGPSAPLSAGADAVDPALTLPRAIKLAAAAYARGDWLAAERLCRAVLDKDAHHLDALHLGGIVAARSGRTHEAADLLQRAAAVGGDNALVHYHRGVALGDLERHAEALQSYDRVVALDPGNARAWNNRGIALACLARHDEALESYDRALSVKPDYAEAFNNRGVALRDLDRHAEALASYDSALRWKPDYVEAISNRGAALAALRRHAEALESYERALALKPGYAEAWNNRGVSLTALERHAEALASYARALELKPGYDFLYGRWLHARMKVCDWEGIRDDIARLESKIQRREKATLPFPLLALTDSAGIERIAAETWVAHKHPARVGLPAIPRRDRRETASDKIRVGYFSADFREHACARLFAGLLEQHDRSRFDVTAFSFGRPTNDPMRQRLSAAVDRFIDVRDRSDRDVALLARGLGIDIAVDLMGFTREARTGIFALRAAPIQVNFLGYPGTMGAAFIDYLIADATLIPPQSRQHFTEAIAYLPESYQPNDDRREISGRTFSRHELGLAQANFVFCCFNNNYKITPSTFDRWMRILREVDGAVLWLLEDNDAATRNLRQEAARRNVSPDRLVFAPLMPSAEHLARHRAADLFLDTLPYNAHTTASDALWAGLPVLTCLGATFAGRVAASLLAAVRLPGLVAATPDEYESLAIELATRPDKLKAMREHLAASRHTVPLFDTSAFARHLEAAYSAMHERYRVGLSPQVIHVAR